MASREKEYAENPKSPSENGGLSAFQLRIAQLIVEGLQAREIAAKLGYPVSTIHGQLRCMYRHAGFSNERVQIVQLALMLHEQRAILGIRCQACGD